MLNRKYTSWGLSYDLCAFYFLIDLSLVSHGYFKFMIVIIHVIKKHDTSRPILLKEWCWGSMEMLSYGCRMEAEEQNQATGQKGGPRRVRMAPRDQHRTAQSSTSTQVPRRWWLPCRSGFCWASLLMWRPENSTWTWGWRFLEEWVGVWGTCVWWRLWA